MASKKEKSVDDYRDRLKSAGILYVDVFPYRIDAHRRLRFLVLKRRDDVVLGGTWQPVCGKLQAGERIRVAFARQVREKTGLLPLELFKLDYVNTFYDDYYDTVMFVPTAACRVDGGDVVVDRRLHVAHEWVTFRELPKYLVWDSQRHCARLINDIVRGRAPRRPLNELKIGL